MIEISYTVEAHNVTGFTVIKGHKTILRCPPPRPPRPPCTASAVVTTKFAPLRRPKKDCSGSTDIIYLA